MYRSRASSYDFRLFLIASLSRLRRASWMFLVRPRSASMCFFERSSNFRYASAGACSSRDAGISCAAARVCEAPSPRRVPSYRLHHQRRVEELVELARQILVREVGVLGEDVGGEVVVLVLAVEQQQVGEGLGRARRVVDEEVELPEPLRRHERGRGVSSGVT